MLISICSNRDDTAALSLPSHPQTSLLAIAMVALLRAIVLSFLAAYSLAVDLNIGFTSYDNDFIEPSYILGKNWNPTTVVAQESIVQWADWLAAQGPWCTCISLPLVSSRLIVPLSFGASCNHQAFSRAVK